MQNHAITKEVEHKKEVGVRCLREKKDYETRSSKETGFKASLPYNVKVIPGDTSIGIT